MYVCHACK